MSTLIALSDDSLVEQQVRENRGISSLKMTRNWSFLFFIFLIAIQNNEVLSYKILGVFPINGRSHYHTAKALMQGLASAGHEVTIASPYKETYQTQNYNQVQLTAINKHCKLNILVQREILRNISV